ncbi:hypothetical protein QIG44_26805, partial [Klebsiella pneumoniae]|nr:hypothetical protein [Klebsiella pneumoniae]
IKIGWFGHRKKEAFRWVEGKCLEAGTLNKVTSDAVCPVGSVIFADNNAVASQHLASPPQRLYLLSFHIQLDQTR